MSKHDIEETVRIFKEHERQKQIEGEVLLLKQTYLDEGLKRLEEIFQKSLGEVEPQGSQTGPMIKADRFLHTLVIRIKVHTDGSKWWYGGFKD